MTLLFNGSPPKRSNWTNPKISALQGNCINTQAVPLITLSVVGYPTSKLELKYSVEFILHWEGKYQTEWGACSGDRFYILTIKIESKESNWGPSIIRFRYGWMWNIPHLKMWLDEIKGGAKFYLDVESKWGPISGTYNAFMRPWNLFLSDKHFFCRWRLFILRQSRPSN